MSRLPLLILISGILLAQCAPAKRTAKERVALLQSVFDTSSVFKKGFTGFVLMDAASGDVLFGKNQDNYFTPASNTKVLTLAVCLHALGDTLDGLEYSINNNVVSFWGTGDPTFLHPKFEAWQPVYHFLTDQVGNKPILYKKGRFTEHRYGAGWAWDDYADYYQPERSEMPIYGNIVHIPGVKNGASSHRIYPPFFENNIHGSPEGFIRAEFENQWDSLSVIQNETDVNIPFRTSDFLQILRDTVHRNDIQEGQFLPENRAYFHTIHSVPADTVFRMMMYESDNFFAEQLLMMSSLQLTATMRQDSAIKYAINKIFPPSPTPPRWVDGSGLSRYNLITPKYMAQVLRQLHDRVPQQTLFSFFPAGGVRGTLINWYGNPAGSPYVFAKTGSMSGVYCLSGYLLTKSGKILIFSCMNNNFVGSNRPWKEEIQKTLRLICEHY